MSTQNPGDPWTKSSIIFIFVLVLFLLSFISNYSWADRVDDSIKRLTAKDSLIRIRAALALAEVGNSKAVEPLIAVLKDQNDYVCISAIIALGEIGDAKAVEPLIAVLEDKRTLQTTARSSAARALGKIAQKGVDPKSLQPAISPLISDLQGQEVYLCLSAAAALGEIGDVKAVIPLTSALSHREAGVRSNAAMALGKIGGQGAVFELEKVAKLDKEASVRQTANKALGKISSQLTLKK